MPHILPSILVATLALEPLLFGCVTEQTPGRAVRYDRHVPIASRLLPGDKEVSIYKVMLPGLEPNPRSPESFDQEVARLRSYETIAVVRPLTVQGELTDGGKWIRTKVAAEIDQIARSAKPVGGSVQFAFDGGTTRIGEVTVTAGTFWRFVPGERYLVFLFSNPGSDELQPARVYLVNANGLLEHPTDKGGRVDGFKTNLVGRNITDVVAALSVP